MFECEKCLHQEICDQSSRLRWACLMEEQRCSDFKDQFSFVEVIRCKNCRYGEIDDLDIPNQYLCHYDGESWNDEDHYCGYGKRVE